ncbi:MAG: orotidine-5'-phosphate decarboxylase [Bacteroidia bacterium]
MKRAELINVIKKQRSYLCVGLDTDLRKIPSFLLKEEDPIFEFNKAIIEETQQYCVAYKPNLAFYESLGPKGLISLQKTLDIIPETHFTIADAKRGDIGNTASMYAKAFFDIYGFDSITVAPYMGRDSIEPFLDYPGKWAIVLGLTSNTGADDFEQLELNSGGKLYEMVIQTVAGYGSIEDTMFVAGATRTEELKRIREIVPDYFLLIPGVGAQGGDLEAVSKATLTKECGILVNASRSILYASSDTDFASAAGREAQSMQMQMATLLDGRI